jgi:hypothetical protein
VKPWTVDPELVRKVRDHLLRREAGALIDFEAVRPQVQELVDLLIPDAQPVRATILNDVAFSVRLGSWRQEAARRVYEHLLPDDVKAGVSLERYVEHRTSVASLTSGVDALLGFYDPVEDQVCLRSLSQRRLVEVALREELRRFFRRGMPRPHCWLPEGTTQATSMEHAMANIVLRRYYDPMVMPALARYPQDGERTWADVFGDDHVALRTFAGAASKQFLKSLPQQYDFTSREHLERIESFYLEEAQVLAGDLAVALEG